jgi:hypothetical protein
VHCTPKSSKTESENRSIMALFIPSGKSPDGTRPELAKPMPKQNSSESKKKQIKNGS